MMVPIRLLAMLPASEDSVFLRDFTYVSTADPWLTSENAAALSRFTSRNISNAQVCLEYGDGGFVDYYQSHRTFSVSMSVESFYRLNRKTVVYGSMSYDNFSGKDMAGSVFIDPSHKPFDIVEDSLTNMGTKHLDTYKLTGGMGIDIYHGISLGARIDYTTANYAKYKDLRHKNSMMDFIMTTGLYLPITKYVFIGMYYKYRRNTESLDFSTYGKTEKKYMSLICYGSFTGQLEQFGATGYTGSNYEMPLLDEYHGGGIQTEWKIAAHLSWYNSFSMSERNGYYGRKSAYTITYSKHDSRLYDYQSRFTLTYPQSQHQLELSIKSENLENKENSYSEIINSSGATTYQYYEALKRANRLWTDAIIAYTAYVGIVNEMPVWTVSTVTNMSRRRQTAYLYPYYRRQNLYNQEYSMDISHNMIASRGILSLSVGGSYKNGSGEPYEDGTYTSPSDKQSAPPSMDTYLYREYEYLTASQYSLRAAVGYTFHIPHTSMDTYLKCNVIYRKANSTNEYLLGREHTVLRMTLGCVF
jgi:hypothetical protein